MSDDEYSSQRLFDPSMAVQRYIFVRNCIQKLSTSTDISSMVDLGCNQCGLVKYIKQLPFMSQINCVDIDSFNLQKSHPNLKINAMDFIVERQRDQYVNLYLGSVLEKDARFGKIDVVTCIELIEHLQPDMIPCLAENVFENIQPKLAIFSTPNYEYNWLIRRVTAEGEIDENEPPNFRDDDHKFEWTRAEFVSWCNGIITLYPNYTYVLDGVGILDSDSELQTGFCTQIAIFSKKQDLNLEVKNCSSTKEVYKLFKTYKYKENVYPK